MGLDCYIRKNVVQKDGKVASEELWYGRKTNEIHGWMQRQSGVPADDFNCVEFYLTKELMDTLQADHVKGNLPATAGFFYGHGGSTEEVATEVKEVLTAAREALNNGELPYYYSWW